MEKDGSFSKVLGNFQTNLGQHHSTSKRPIQIWLSIFQIPFVLAGTSNWAEDYFSITGGLGLVIEPDLKWQLPVGMSRNEKSLNLRDHLEKIFKRDWSSEYAEKLTL